MAISADEVMIGEFFITVDQELRKVVRVDTNGLGHPRVWYQRKSATVPNESFLFGHTQADPPTLEEFTAQCDHRLSWTEVRHLRQQGILLQYE